MVGVAALLASGNAVSALAAHYLGSSRDRSEFRVYLHGGEFLSRKGTVNTLRVTVHWLRRGGRMQSLEGCVYRFDDADRRRDRIECDVGAVGPLAGVAYARDPKPLSPGAEDTAPMVCVRRCGPQVPARMELAEADEDNG